MIRDADGIRAPATARPPPAGQAGTAAPATAPGEPAAPAAPGVPLVNPRMRIEAALNLVVLEFRDGDGTVSRSIPSAREIDAYRNGQLESSPTRADLDVEG